MAITTIYGPQDWTDGTFAVGSTPDGGDANYDFVNYREDVKTVDAAGPSGERVLDAFASDRYDTSALDEENFGPTSGHFDARGADDGTGVFYEGDVQFSAAAEAVNGDFNIPFNVAKDSLLRYFLTLRVALTEGKIYLDVKGDGEMDVTGGATVSADDSWHTIKIQIVPSSDAGSTADGIVRVWMKDSTDDDDQYVALFEKLDSFAFVNTTGTAYMLNYVAYGHYGVLPAVNWTIYYGEEDEQLQVVMFGRGAAADDKARVTSDLTVLMNLDGQGRTVHRPNTLYVAGDLVVTGDVIYTGATSSPTTFYDSIVTADGELVVDEDGNVVFVEGSE